MKRILLTTTSLVLAAGVAQAEVTFSGKAEAGVSRTSKVDAATAAVEMEQTTSAGASDEGFYKYTDNVLTFTKASGTAGKDADAIAAQIIVVQALIDIAAASALEDDLLAQTDAAAGSIANYVAHADDATAHRAEVARLNAVMAKLKSGVVAAKKEGDSFFFGQANFLVISGDQYLD